MQKFLTGMLALVVVLTGIGYLLIQKQHAGELEEARAQAEEQLEVVAAEADALARELAADLVRLLSLAVIDNVASGDLESVESRLARAVQGNRLVSVLVLSQEGAVLSSTDLRFRGRVLDDPATRAAARVTEVTVSDEPPAPGQVEVVAPLIADGERLGFIRAAVELDQGAEEAR